MDLRLRIASAVLGCLAILAAVVVLQLPRPAPSTSGVRYSPSNLQGHVVIAEFIGDSTTVGVGASVPYKRWSTLLSTAEGWREDNRALGGTGYVSSSTAKVCGFNSCKDYRGVVETIATDSPQIIVVAGGQADADDWVLDPRRVTLAVRATFARLRTDHPAATIIAVGPTSAKVDDAVRGLDRAVQAAARTTGARYVSLLDPPVVEASMVLPDRVHLNDAGHAAIAATVVAALR